MCGDLNIDTVKKLKDKFDYEKILLAFDFRKQNFVTTTTTPSSATCLDHNLASHQVETETIKTAIIDLYTVLGTTHGVITNETPCTEMKPCCRDLRHIKGENALNFLFLLETLKKLEPL